MITSQAPGKLFIAGEYAVVNKGYPAILIAVDRFIKASIIKSKDVSSIKTYNLSPVIIKRVNNQIPLTLYDKSLAYVISSINTFEQFLSEKKIDLRHYDLIIESDLESSDNVKYGLGSSAAVTVATLKVLSKFYNLSLSKQDLFKLALISQFKINDKGSGGDLAASVYTGLIYYRSFDRRWLKTNINSLSISKLLEMPWPYLEILNLKLLKNLTLLVGWTKKPASSFDLVSQLNQAKKESTDYYTNFLSESKVCVNKLKFAIENDDKREILNQIKINRLLLAELGKKFNVEIETDQLKALSDIVANYGGSGKLSGAGGGDCGVGVFKGSYAKLKIIREWEQAGIKYLDLNIYKELNNNDK